MSSSLQPEAGPTDNIGRSKYPGSGDFPSYRIKLRLTIAEITFLKAIVVRVFYFIVGEARGKGPETTIRS